MGRQLGEKKKSLVTRRGHTLFGAFSWLRARLVSGTHARGGKGHGVRQVENANPSNEIRVCFSSPPVFFENIKARDLAIPPVIILE